MVDLIWSKFWQFFSRDLENYVKKGKENDDDDDSDSGGGDGGSGGGDHLFVYIKTLKSSSFTSKLWKNYTKL